MKKKGLIISTVVMVVVLIASLTTATYAWFTTSTKTTLDGFNFSVVAGNAVNIGVKQNNQHTITPADSDFRSGTVTYQSAVAGQLGTGTWDGNTGLGATVSHGIKWGAQSKAVGAINTTDNTTPSTTASDYGFIGTGKFDKSTTDTVGMANKTLATGAKTYLNAANKGATDATLDGATAAYPNFTPAISGDETTNGDYAYLFLGVSPTQDLVSNELVIMLDGTNSQMNTIGMLAAIHVAYRVTKSGASAVTTQWTEVEFFSGKTQADSLNNATLDTTSFADAYNTAYGTTAPTSKASVVKISNLTTTQGAIDQIELIVYLAGADADCVDNAKGASGDIKIFFNAVQKSSSTKPTSATIGTDGKLTVVGTTANTDANTTVKAQINGGEWTTIAGTWSNGTFTSTNTIGAKKDDVVNITLTETDKKASDSVKATNNMTA